ncbi:hypothetical protein Cgig2_020826 [Carnegiea gigantea]|uniref:Uncharacterized protein n=1 Tax=Carnegiea gigantea TaxID=171969 RepID=A0A9Q1KJA4_9CARY|nr:hypothetical protein Cgig2_020826 [Carnegiea gigantea]
MKTGVPLDASPSLLLMPPLLFLKQVRAATIHAASNSTTAMGTTIPMTSFVALLLVHSNQELENASGLVFQAQALQGDQLSPVSQEVGGELARQVKLLEVLKMAYGRRNGPCELVHAQVQFSQVRKLGDVSEAVRAEIKARQIAKSTETEAGERAIETCIGQIYAQSLQEPRGRDPDNELFHLTSASASAVVAADADELISYLSNLPIGDNIKDIYQCYKSIHASITQLEIRVIDEANQQERSLNSTQFKLQRLTLGSTYIHHSMEPTAKYAIAANMQVFLASLDSLRCGAAGQHLVPWWYLSKSLVFEARLGVKI